MILKQQAADWLLAQAERYHIYCCDQDNILLGLLRIGRHGLAYFDRQAAALPWLMERGKFSKEHNEKQDTVGASLVKHGQHTLELLNAREECFGYLKRRRLNAEALIVNQAAAIVFLRAQVASLFGNEQNVIDTEKWLVERSRRALIFSAIQEKAVKKLMFTGGRARVVYRKSTQAFIYLQQVGQFARVTNFNRKWPALNANGNEGRVDEEVVRLNTKQNKLYLERMEAFSTGTWSHTTTGGLNKHMNMNQIGGTVTNASANATAGITETAATAGGVSSTTDMSGTGGLAMEPATEEEKQLLQDALGSPMGTVGSLGNTGVSFGSFGESTKRLQEEAKVEDKWEAELRDAFTLLAKAVFMPGDSVNDKKSILDIERVPFMSFVGFKRLMRDGEILKMTPKHVIEGWAEIDPQHKGFVPFEDIWDWFKREALHVHRQIFKKSKGSKSFMFRCSDIVSVREQVLLVFKARFAVQELRMLTGKAEDEGESESEEEESSDEEDEDTEEEEEDEANPDMEEYDKVFKRLITQHTVPGQDYQEMHEQMTPKLGAGITYDAKAGGALEGSIVQRDAPVAADEVVKNIHQMD